MNFKELFKCDYFSIINEKEASLKKPKIIPIQVKNEEDVILKDNLDIFFYNLDKFLWLALKLTEFLAILHSNKIIYTALNSYSICIASECHDIKVIDFSRANVLDETGNNFTNSDFKDFEKPYLAPEQLEFISYPVEQQTDFYSLGIIFYELLTKNLPIYTKNQILALDFKKNKTIPKTIIYIVKKLLNKYPQDRYQSAEGLLYDLSKCKEQLDKKGTIDPFFPGAKDKPTKLVFSDYLYGREKETNEIRQIFKAVSSGFSAFLLISGYSGIGKTALVEQVLKTMAMEKGLFLQGKYDQFINKPYVAISEAIRNFVNIISQNDQDIIFWKNKLNKELQPNAQVIIDLVPEFESIIGSQPVLPSLDPEKAKNRFNYVFQKFVECITNENNPLVIFLDDLQWIDNPSMEPLKTLIEKEIDFFLIVGAYRDNECCDGHPLLALIDELKTKGQNINKVMLSGLSTKNVYTQIDSLFKRITEPVKEIPLEGLAKTNIQEQVEDIFNCDEAESKQLSEIIYRKTMGNPFFIRQLLYNLQEQQKIIFDFEKNEWLWSIEDINELNLADNVGELMSENIRMLHAKTKEILKYAACLGNTFDLGDLSIILNIDLLNISVYLRQAEYLDFIIKTVDKKYIREDSELAAMKYKFLHDKIQQAAYELIPKDKRAEIHLKIGQSLLKNYDKDKLKENVFAVVDHLNIGKRLIKKNDEKLQLIELNLLAGNEARNSTAYISAKNYYCIAKELLPKNHWQELYALSYEIYKKLAESAYLCADFEQSELHMNILLKKTKSKLERAEILHMKVVQYTAVGELKKAIITGLHALRILGVNIPLKPNKIYLLKEKLFLKWKLKSIKIAELKDIELNSDQEKKICMRLLMDLFSPTYFLDYENLYILITLTALGFIVKYGNFIESAFFYMTYSVIVTKAGKPKKGQIFGQLALILNEKYVDMEYKCRVYWGYATFIHHWSYHFRSLESYYQKAIDAGLKSGDLYFLGYTYLHVSQWKPDIDLVTAIKEAENYLSIMKKMKYQNALQPVLMLQQFRLNLTGRLQNKFSLSSNEYDELKSMEIIKKINYSTGISCYHIIKMELCFFYEDYHNAFLHYKKAKKFFSGLSGMPWSTEFYIYSFLLIATYSAKGNWLKKIYAFYWLKKEYFKMKKRAAHCPVNFLHHKLLMEAEIARLKKRYRKAAVLYDRAIQIVKKNQYLRYEALCNEITAKFYLSQTNLNTAKRYMEEAVKCYEKWGAMAKVKHIREKYGKHFNNVL